MNKTNIDLTRLPNARVQLGKDGNEYLVLPIHDSRNYITFEDSRQIILDVEFLDDKSLLPHIAKVMSKEQQVGWIDQLK